jgi:Phage portal protein, SPP1 Gp6-like
MTVLDDLRAAGVRKLDYQAAVARRYLRYYDGDVTVPAILDSEDRQVFRRFLAESGANWSELVVNAVAERLSVAGFRFGAGSDAAWLLWQANGMDAGSELVQTDALVTGSCPVLVQLDETNPAGVAITGESPLEACVLYQAGRRRARLAAYKRFMDADQQTIDYVMTPDLIATWWPHDAQPEVTANPAGAVTMVEVVPQPRMAGPPRSELLSVLPVQDRINTTIFNRLVATDYGAFRQVWATGVKLARKVIAGEDGAAAATVVERPYDIGANRLLVNERPEGRFGSFPESTLAGYIGAVEQDVHQLAAITQTPPHYLLASMINLSADAIKAAEAGLVAKVSRRALHIGEAWEEIMRLALALIGSPAATDVEGEVVWRDWETRSEGQRVDALVKMGSLGVPRRVLWERWGATPQEIERWEALAAAEAPAALPAPAVPEGPP